MNLKKLTVNEIKTLLRESCIKDCLADICEKQANLMDLKVRILGFSTGLYRTPTTFTREDLITAFNECCEEEGFLEEISERREH